MSSIHPVTAAIAIWMVIAVVICAILCFCFHLKKPDPTSGTLDLPTVTAPCVLEYRVVCPEEEVLDDN